MNMSQGHKMPEHMMSMKFSIKGRFWTSLLLCLPLFLMSVGNNFFNLSAYLNHNIQVIVQFIISFIVVFICGSFFFSKAFHSVINRNLDMFTLIALAVGTAWFYSFFVIIFPQNIPPSFHQTNGSIPVYFDASCYISMFVLLGHYLEMKGRMTVNSDIMKILQNKIPPEKMPQIQKILDNAHKDDIPMQKLVNKVSQYFIVLVIITAVCAFIFWDKHNSSAYALITAVSVLLAACPCALTLAAPISVMIGMNKAADKGILINNPDIMENIHKENDVESLLAKQKIMPLGNQDINTLLQADIILLQDTAETKDELEKISNKVLFNIKENLAWGSLYNLITVPVAAGILYPWWGITLSPVTASIAMSLSSVIVVINALRLRKQL